MKCGVCSSVNLTPYHDYASFDNHVRIKSAIPGKWSNKDLTLKADRAVVCRDCGYLMLFISHASVRSYNEIFPVSGE